MELYIFGAGASATEGHPTTNTVLVEAWQRLGSVEDARIEAVWRFCRDLFGVTITGPESFASLPAIDQIFGLVDWSLQSGQGLGHAYDPRQLFDIRRSLEYLVRQTLRLALANVPRPSLHDILVARLLQIHGRQGFAIISLNYDTLLDHAFATTGIGPDYGFRALDLGDMNLPLLAKLHGSLNWWLCRACDHITVCDEPCRLRCARCGNPDLHGMLIPPTWRKSYDSPQLRHVLDLSLEAVMAADRIIFVGYSMPAADVAIYHLICRGLLTRSACGRPRFIVINHSDSVVEHFRRLFGANVEFQLSGFQNFVRMM